MRHPCFELGRVIHCFILAKKTNRNGNETYLRLEAD
jgi:hypothetical protein